VLVGSKPPPRTRLRRRQVGSCSMAAVQASSWREKRQGGRGAGAATPSSPARVAAPSSPAARDEEKGGLRARFFASEGLATSVLINNAGIPHLHSHPSSASHRHHCPVLASILRPAPHPRACLHPSCHAALARVATSASVCTPLLLPYARVHFASPLSSIGILPHPLPFLLVSDSVMHSANS
jgi:hypothetical protein